MASKNRRQFLQYAIATGTASILGACADTHGLGTGYKTETSKSARIGTLDKVIGDDWANRFVFKTGEPTQQVYLQPTASPQDFGNLFAPTIKGAVERLGNIQIKIETAPNTYVPAMISKGMHLDEIHPLLELMDGNFDQINRKPSKADVYARILMDRPEYGLQKGISITKNAQRIPITKLLSNVDPSKIAHFFNNWTEHKDRFSGGAAAFVSDGNQLSYTVIPRGDGIMTLPFEALVAKLSADYGNKKITTQSRYFFDQRYNPVGDLKLFNFSEDGIIVPAIRLYHHGYFLSPLHITNDDLRQWKVDRKEMSHYLKDHAMDRVAVDAALGAIVGILTTPLGGLITGGVNLWESNEFGRVVRRNDFKENPERNYFSDNDLRGMANSSVEVTNVFSHPVIGSDGTVKGVAQYELGGLRNEAVFYQNGAYISQGPHYYLGLLSKLAIAGGAIALSRIARESHSNTIDRTTIIDRTQPGAGHIREGGNQIKVR